MWKSIIRSVHSALTVMKRSFLTTWTDGRTDGKEGVENMITYAIVGKRIRRIQEKKVDRCSLDLSSSSPILNFEIIVMVVRKQPSKREEVSFDRLTVHAIAHT